MHVIRRSYREKRSFEEILNISFFFFCILRKKAIYKEQILRGRDIQNLSQQNVSFVLKKKKQKNKSTLEIREFIVNLQDQFPEAPCGKQYCHLIIE